MKLEFLKNINRYDEHAIRLSDFNSSQAVLFREVIVCFIASEEIEINLVNIDFIQYVNCNLTIRISDEDIGISTKDQLNFFCNLTTATYQMLIFLLEPFCKKKSKGYQWLYDIDTPIGFLFSAGSDIPFEE
jgi:hypothetical protein